MGLVNSESFSSKIRSKKRPRWSLREDLAVRWCIQHQVFRVYEVMEVVEEMKESVP